MIFECNRLISILFQTSWRHGDRSRRCRDFHSYKIENLQTPLRYYAEIWRVFVHTLEVCALYVKSCMLKDAFLQNRHSQPIGNSQSILPGYSPFGRGDKRAFRFQVQRACGTKDRYNFNRLSVGKMRSHLAYTLQQHPGGEKSLVYRGVLRERSQHVGG